MAYLLLRALHHAQAVVGTIGAEISGRYKRR